MFFTDIESLARTLATLFMVSIFILPVGECHSAFLISQMAYLMFSTVFFLLAMDIKCVITGWHGNARSATCFRHQQLLYRATPVW